MFPEHDKLRRELVRIETDGDDFDDELDYCAARREDSLAMEALEQLGPTSYTLKTTMSASSPRNKTRQGSIAGRMQSLDTMSFTAPIGDTTNAFDSPLSNSDLKSNAMQKQHDMQPPNAATALLPSGVFSSKEEPSPSATSPMTSPRDATSSTAASADDDAKPIRRVSTRMSDTLNSLARAATLRRKPTYSSTSSLLRKVTARNTQAPPAGTRKAGVFELPCNTATAMADMRAILESFFCASKINERGADIRMQVKTRLPKYDKACIFNIIIGVEDRVSYTRLSMRRNMADTFRMDNDAFDAFCTQVFNRLVNERQVVRPFC